MMNKHIERLATQADAWFPDGYPSAEGGDEEWRNLVIFEKEDLEKFAKYIMEDTVYTIIKAYKGHINPKIALKAVQERFEFIPNWKESVDGK